MPVIPENYFNAVVSIGSVNNDSFSAIATGFLYGYYVKPAKGGVATLVFLVTNRHVFEGKESLKIRFNKLQGEESQLYDITLIRNGNEAWVGHPNPEIDIATILLNGGRLKIDGLNFDIFKNPSFGEKADVLSKDQLVSEGVSEGYRLFVLGFPMGIAGDEFNYVIVRKGVIARIRDVIQDKSNSILIDSMVFPGNSGGPVVLGGGLEVLVGSKVINRVWLLGIVSSYLPYEETAISKQTGRPRISFQENSGLAVIHPAYLIDEVVEHYIATSQDKRLTQAWSYIAELDDDTTEE